MANKLLPIALISLSLMSTSVRPNLIKASESNEESTGESVVEENKTRIKLYQVESPFNFHTTLQQKYIDDGNLSIAKYAKGEAEISQPESLKIEWDIFDYEGEKRPYYTLKLSENNDFSSSWTYRTYDTFYYVYNLKLATKYYYSVSASIDGNIVTSETKYFVTANTSIRNLRLDGVINVRDVGGWRNREGKFMVKQGMVYRSGPFNVSYASSMQKSITSSGLIEASRLGIKTEIDLRTVDNNEVGGLKSVSPLGSGVKYIQAPLDYNYPEKIFTHKNNAESFKKIFKVFADPSSYPINFHCTAGADRTGCIAFLLNGLMGVSEADLYRDYLFTNFASVGPRTRSSISVAYVKTISNNPGKTLQDKIVSTLTSIGVDINDLNSIYFLLQEEGYRI